MKRIVLLFGLLAGFVISGMMAITVPLTMNGVIAFEYGEEVGYTSMVLAFVAVFFGIRSYREKVAGGTIGFGKAFQVGILIVLVASAVYVLGWQIVYHNFVPDFADRYTKLVLENMRAEGESPAEIAAMEKQLAQFKEWYKNPLFNVAITFMEIFPVGLIVTLISAAILRRSSDERAAVSG